MRNLGILAAIALLTVVASVHAGADGSAEIEITLQDEVRLQRRTFTLSDIADLNGGDKRLLSRLRHIHLGSTPRAGTRARIARDEIARRIDRLVPGFSKHVTWLGSEQVSVQGQYRRFEQQAYLDAAQRHIEGWLGERYQEFAAKPVGQYKDLELPAGRLDIRFKVAQRQRVNKRMCVWLDLLIDEAHYSTLPVWFEVSAFSQVYALRQTFSAGTPVNAEMLISTHRDLTAISGEPVTDQGEIEGQRLIRDLSKGEVLTRSELQPVPDVVKGQSVRVQASVGKVTLFATARALEDGNRGDPIRVERLDGSDSYMARVLDSGLAIVEEDYR